MSNTFPVEKFNKLNTPFYYYDIDLLKKTAATLKKEADKYGYTIHYALKANANDKILNIIQQHGFGADCVSGNEILKAIACGFSPSDIAFAGVGKTDKEIEIGLNNRIFTFNCESIPEIENINQIAAQKNVIADIAVRINPNIDAHTHQYITTGLEENKFGISRWQFNELACTLKQLQHVSLKSLHFHVGSQITDFKVFEMLGEQASDIVEWFESQGFLIEHINLGGGLCINYETPNEHLVADFSSYFSIFNRTLRKRSEQKVHFELGRSIVGQCGSLITKVLYVKKGQHKNFTIVDAGMTDLIRPSLYQAYHKIENISSSEANGTYDIVGPICESADCFVKAASIADPKRNDLLAIRSAGAYGEVMASRYNLRDLPEHYYSDEI